MSIALGVKWSEVEIQPTIIPEGEYQFRLLGGRNENSRTLVTTLINDGEYTGRKFSFSYPNFDEQAWGLTEFKRLTIALGLDIDDNESAENYLSRAAGQTFVMKVFHSKFKDTATGEERTSAKPRLSSVRPG